MSMLSPARVPREVAQDGGADLTLGQHLHARRIGRIGDRRCRRSGGGSQPLFQPELARQRQFAFQQWLQRGARAVCSATLECRLLASCGFAEVTMPVMPPWPSSAISTLR